MKKTLYAKSAAINVLDDLNIDSHIHSIFENGINIESKKGLIFIGSDKNGELPFGIHMNKKDIEYLVDVERESNFKFDKELIQLISRDVIIDLSKVSFYSSKLPKYKDPIAITSINYLFNKIVSLNLETGLDMGINDLLYENNFLIDGLREGLLSQDCGYIKESLRKIIGRGRGLTPSGDDLLIGLLWVNHIREYVNNKFLACLKELILEEELTTDVSINYYKAAFEGDFSSRFIELYNALANFDELSIEKLISKFVEYGHTSGRDTLAGIALGIDMVIK